MRQMIYKPGPVQRRSRLDDHSSRIFVTKYLKQPTRTTKSKVDSEQALLFLFGFAPGGVYHAASVTSRAVRSYRTLSPLPTNDVCRRSTLCCTFRRLSPPRRYLAPCPMKPGLSSPVSVTKTSTAATVQSTSCAHSIKDLI